jgi:K+-sensing histidine kinase KdpD
LELVNNVLDFSKIESGEIEPEKVAFNLKNLIQESLLQVNSRAQLKELSLTYDYPPELCRVFLGDPLRIKQILFNLLSNAIKFTESGGVHVSVKEKSQKKGVHFLSLSVEDTGIGIPKDFLKLIFSPFAQADISTARKHGGTGLGLSIVKSLVKLMNGSINISSEEKKGTCISFLLPLEVSPDKNIITDLDFSALKGKRIFLIDAHSVKRNLVKVFLQEKFCIVEEADSTQSAISYFQDQNNKPFDMIISDNVFSDMNGFDFKKH